MIERRNKKGKNKRNKVEMDKIQKKVKKKLFLFVYMNYKRMTSNECIIWFN